MKLIDEALLDEFRGPGRCESCAGGCQRRHPHHLLAKGMGGGGRVDIRLNIISLCPSCHAHAHQVAEERKRMFAIVAEREGVPVEAISAAVWEVRRKP